MGTIPNVLRLIGIAISIGLADSINPSTIGPALYLATGERPRETVTKFTFGVFAVYLVGGLLIAAGPGQLLLSLIPKPSRLTSQLLEVVAGIVMIAVGLIIWRHRFRLGEREPPIPRAGTHGSTLLGAGIIAVELPTAFPYFFAIAAIVGSGQALPKQIFLIVLFNICFVLPLLSIVATLWWFGDTATVKLARGRALLQRHWPVLLATVALVAGLLVIALGATGIAARVHGRLGRFFKHVNHLLH
jgi:cytochrome c biogenesis protein CcdA